MNPDRTCFSCEQPIRATMSIPVSGLKKALFCGDHYQLGETFFCHPCAGQLTRLGIGTRREETPEN
jgi:hypothetical protein